MRREQAEAVNKTHAYFHSIWKEDMHAVPRFLWNAKMRFGKTFTTYQLAKKLGAKRVLVVTFKPAVEDAWQTDLESHVDFDGWQYLSRNPPAATRRQIDRKKPVVYFGSFQDLLGRDAAGNIKPKNEWLHEVNWDLVVFDEYHFGAWRDTAKELFEGEEEAVAKKEAKLEYAAGLEDVNEDLSELSEKETEFLPITTKAYLYLSGTPFKALATGEFIEEQIFNWTYTDEQRAKEEFAAKNPGKWNPYGALPQMRLLTYQMPDELLAIASAGRVRRVRPQRVLRGHGHGRRARSSSTRATCRSGWTSSAAQYAPKAVESLKTGTRPPFPYSDVRLLPYLQHSFWFLPNVAACHAMANLLAEKHNTFWHDYKVVVAAGASAGIGLDALPPVRKAIGSGFETKTITLSCGKLTTGVTVPQWSSILMLRNLKSPGDLLSGGVPRAVAVVDQEPERRRPERGGDPQACLLRVRLRAHARAAAALRVRDRAFAQRAEPGERGQGPRVVPAGAGLRRREHDADRRGRHPRHRDGGHVGHAAGAQVGERAAGERGQRHAAPHPRQPRGDGRRGAHRGLARAGRQHHRDHHQQEREGQGTQEQGQGQAT